MRVERALLGHPVADDLDRVGRSAGDGDVLGEDPDGRGHGRPPAVARSECRRRQRGRPDVSTRGPRRRDAVHVGQTRRHVEPARSEDVVVVVHDQRDRPRSATAEDQAVRAGVLRIGGLAGQAGTDLVEPRVEHGRARARQRARDRDVERDGQDEQDDERRPAAPQDEVAPDVPDQPAVRGVGGQFGRSGLGRGQDPVRHRPDDSPRRGRSRSACRPNRACRAGSGRRHRPRSGSPPR